MIILKVAGGIFGSILGTIGLVWGIASLILSIVFLIPLLGWLNWISIPFAAAGMVFSMLAMGSEATAPLGKAGLILGGTAIVLGCLRLILGGGLL